MHIIRRLGPLHGILEKQQVLRAATSDCALAIGLGDVTGQIRKGYSADFLLFEDDPTLDLDLLASPAQVYKQGALVA